MIAEARFVRSSDGFRRLRFSPRSSIPLEAACVVANGLRETLREVCGEACELVVGEPSALSPEAWRALAQDAFLFLTRGRQTDIVLVIPQPDARRLVLRAFGEGPAAPGADGRPCSALEVAAIEKIAARCAVSFDPLCAERRSASRAIAHADVPPCVAYFDVRVYAPIPVVLGIAIVRALPDAGPAGRLAPAALERIGIGVRVAFATATVDAAALLRWRIGDVIAFDTPLTAAARLTVGGRALAAGQPGIAGTRAALRIGSAAAAG